MLSDDRPTNPAGLPIFFSKEFLMENAFGMFPGFEPDEWSNDACRGYVIMAMEDCGFSKKDIRRVVALQSVLTSGHIGPKWRKLKGRHLRVPSFDISPQDKRETLASTPILKRRFPMTQAVTYQRETKSVPFQGKTIVLESLTPVLSPKEKEQRKKEIERRLYDVFR